MEEITDLIRKEDINKEVLLNATTVEQILICREIQNRINQKKESLYIN